MENRDREKETERGKEGVREAKQLLNPVLAFIQQITSEDSFRMTMIIMTMQLLSVIRFENL